MPNGRRQTSHWLFTSMVEELTRPATNLKLWWLIRTKHFPDSETLPRIQTHPRIWILEVFLNSGMCFGFREVFLDSGKCFGFWEVFVDSGKPPYETNQSELFLRFFNLLLTVSVSD